MHTRCPPRRAAVGISLAGAEAGFYARHTLRLLAPNKQPPTRAACKIAQGCLLSQAKSPGIERYRSELSTCKPVNLLPNRYCLRLHTTVTTAATQPHHNLSPQLSLSTSHFLGSDAGKERRDLLINDLPSSPCPLPSRLARVSHHKRILPTLNTTILSQTCRFEQPLPRSYQPGPSAGGIRHCQRPCQKPLSLRDPICIHTPLGTSPLFFHASPRRPSNGHLEPLPRRSLSAIGLTWVEARQRSCSLPWNRHRANVH